MISKRELEQAIRECEQAKVSYQTCEKLATFYTVYDHLYNEAVQEVAVPRKTIPSKLMELANGKSEDEVWKLVDELIDAVQVLHPKLYDNFVRKLAE